MNIISENQLLGTDAWRRTRPSINHEIEGFASATSVNHGENIAFYINTKASTFRIDIFRMGWYQGHFGRLMLSIANLNGVSQPKYLFETERRLVECNWRPSYKLLL